MIQTKELNIGYGGRCIQGPLSIRIESGEMVCMIGPNGAGKTTLLRTLAGLLPKMSGQVEMGEAALVLTEHDAMSETTVHDIVAMGRYRFTSFLGKLSAEDERVVAESLQAVGGGESLRPERRFCSLSDGEKQRVLIAKALAQESEVILLDEPTAHLDIPNRIMILRLLSDLAHQQGKTILISTHELELAIAHSDRILLMYPNGGGTELEKAERLKALGSFDNAFGMKVFG